MNNLLNYDAYLNRAEELICADEINEGIKNVINKAATAKVRAELADEIEMSKSIMEGITDGLDKLSDNFDAIKKDIAENKDEELKGEKQKKLDEITKIIANSREQTWDLNELIDEGEIDYAGFTANVGLASAAYFGIILFPMRAGIIIHKGYNYFFNLIKNTIRKALVMLQINFTQFENLIIYESFVSADYIEAKQSSNDISEFFGKLQAALVGSGKSKGAIKRKKTADEVEKAMNAYKKQFDMKEAIKKRTIGNNNPYNALDPYNNTYNKTLEVLKQYSQEDVQKQLDSIKNSINKFAGGDQDLQAYGELIIAAAEEHAYKVSSSIYNKFAKMSEVFSLPNQQKMIKLITDAAQEEQDQAAEVAAKLKESENEKKIMEAAKKKEESAAKIFKDHGGKLGDIDENNRYKDVSVDPKDWTYDKFEEFSDDDKDVLNWWFKGHPEVLEKCDETLKVTIHLMCGKKSTDIDYRDYVDVLVDSLDEAVDTEIQESYVLDFANFICEDKDDESEDDETSKKSKTIYCIKLENIEDSDVSALESMFTGKRNGVYMEDIAIAACKTIGKDVIKNKTFISKVKSIVGDIRDALNDKDNPVKITKSSYVILKESIKQMKDARNDNYGENEGKNNEDDKSEDNKEKSEK